MGDRISLALVLHNHQPVGNFGWVIAEAFERAYLPMLAALERHPAIRAGLHYTGPLIEWIRVERPDFLGRLADLVARDQVELLGGGYYEPVLASLPERDRIAQLRRMADEVERIGGRRPTGAWLAERVWEPDVPTSIVDAGYRWTILDDAHFRAAAIDDSALWGAYTTEDQGRLLTVFGSDKQLRYGLPFGSVDDAIAHLLANATAAGDRLAFMGDDGEKFGAWPDTYDHCWGADGWVERFFAAVETHAPMIATVTPSDWLAGHPPIGRAYVPTSSYFEMGEWALPADQGLAFEETVKRATAAGEPWLRWLHGGFWRNFQVKYREINELHKQMLRASARVATMPDGPARMLALDHLHKGQSNDCYWHGVFGGIYISHMRLATAEHLIAAEDLADLVARDAGTSVDGICPADTDLDGRDEILAGLPGQLVVIDPAEGGGIGSWDIRAVRHALTSVLRRRPEAYHAWLAGAEGNGPPAINSPAADGEPADGAPADGGSLAERYGPAPSAAAAHDGAPAPSVAATHDGAPARSAAAAHDGAPVEPGSPVASDPPGGAAGDRVVVATIHEIVRSREPDLAARLHYDAYERRSGLVHLFAPGTSMETFAAAEAEELGDAHDGAYEVLAILPDAIELARDVVLRSGSRRGRQPDGDPVVRVTKRFVLGGDRRAPSLGLEVGVENRSSEPVRFDLGLEWALTMLGGGANPDAYYRVGAATTSHDSAGQDRATTEIVSGNRRVGLELTTTFTPVATAWWTPIETISNSEFGFERVYQGSALVGVWPTELAPGEQRRVTMGNRVRADSDRSAEELGGTD